MDKKKIKIGVVGLGRIGWDYHCKKISQNKNYELVAVTDVSEDRCLEAKTVYGCAAYTKYSDFLEHPNLEVVVIATPTHMHKEMTIQALTKGFDVVLEKPMASNAKEAKAIIDAAKKYRCKLTVFQPARLAAYFRHLKEIIKSGILGDVYHIKINRYKFQRRDDWQSIKKYGGGMLANYGSHVLGQLLELMGNETKKLFCTLRCVATLGDADDVVKIVVQNTKGILGEVEINSASFATPNYFEVVGTLGSLTLNDDNEFVITYFQKKELKQKKLKKTLSPADRLYPKDNISPKQKKFLVDKKFEIDLYTNFYQSLRHNKPLAVLPEEVLEVVKFIDACKKTAGKELITKL